MISFTLTKGDASRAHISVNADTPRLAAEYASLKILHTGPARPQTPAMEDMFITTPSLEALRCGRE
jgi:hypothetical protein